MIPDWIEELAKRGCAVEDRIDQLRQRLRRRAGNAGRLQILPYRGFGNEREIFAHGRVLAGAPPAAAAVSSLQKVLAMYRRFASQEVPDQRVVVRFEGETIETISDHEGFFGARLPNRAGRTSEPWRSAEYELDDGTRAAGRIFIPAAGARFGVISDIDDTIVISHATNLPRMVWTLLLKDARGRVAFPGVSAFYRALHGPERNPFFYVSSGPWNLYDLLIDFFELNRVPDGPLFLQDYGLERDRFLMASHHKHKLAQMARILEMHPGLPFILIGDSGQKDPEIYARLLEESPSRILAVYIRDVSGPGRDKEVARLCDAARLRGSDLIFVQDSVEAARHAVSRGFIPETALAEIVSDKGQDLSAARQSLGPAGLGTAAAFL